MTRAAKAIEIGSQYVGKIGYLLGAKANGLTLKEIDQAGKPLDCSGFMRELLREVGVSIVDGSQQQRAACRSVPLSLALGPQGAGCLLFMSPKPGRNWPRHVALSLGDGKSLECCSGSGVSIKARKGTSWTAAGKLDSLFVQAGG
jgi:cell wall-associated NlpC family hydrolase